MRKKNMCCFLVTKNSKQSKTKRPKNNRLQLMDLKYWFFWTINKAKARFYNLCF